MRKQNFTLTGQRDSVTGAEYASFLVTVGDKKIPAQKRIFRTEAEISKIPLGTRAQMVNYTEDLWVRGEVTSANTPKGQKDAERTAAGKVMGAQALFALLRQHGAGNGLNKELDRFFAENEEECRKVMVS